jgi:hypothetical protein
VVAAIDGVGLRVVVVEWQRIRIALEGGCYVRSSGDIICSVRGGETTFGIVVG